MELYEIIILAVGLAMDAFAVSICKGLSVGKIRLSHSLKAGLWFGGFQGLMPLIGYFFAGLFASFIDAYDHWIAFGLLFLIGANMIREVFSKEEKQNDNMGFKTMFLMAIATSIDALAVGITFAFLDVNVFLAAGIIGAITFVLSAIGVKIGSIFGSKYRSKAELVGGIILILLGVKILLEGLGVFRLY